ncbi:MAG: hypothetical protein LBG64_01820 [Pseudomonadales bacterium]|jgi:hypothetical protein|nr:hypothetical protein [Pseudomonadales bacterium]
MAKKIKFKSYDFLLAISFVICAISFIVVVFVMPNLQPLIPLYYSLASGEQQLANREHLYVLPIISLIISITTLIFVSVSRNYDELLLKLFTLCAIVFQILIGSIIIRTIWLVM